MPVSRAPAQSASSSPHRVEIDDGGEIGARRRMLAVPGFEPRAALGEGKRAQIFASLEQHVVEADMGRMRFQHAGVTVLRLSRCCRSLNGATSPLAHHQQLAVEHHALAGSPRPHRERRRRYRRRCARRAASRRLGGRPARGCRPISIRRRSPWARSTASSLSSIGCDSISGRKVARAPTSGRGADPDSQANSSV